MQDATRRSAFFKRCWADAFGGAWAWFGAISTSLGVLLPAIVAIASRIPEKRRGVISHALTNPAVPDLVWFVPLAVAVIVLAYRLFIVAPHDIFVKEERARRVAEDALRPRFDLIHNHDSRAAKWMSGDQNPKPLYEYHRVVVINRGASPIDDVRVYVQKYSGIQDSIDLEPMHADGKPVTLFDDNPIAFNLLEYDYDHVRIVGKKVSPEFRFTEPFDIMIAVVGNGVTTLRRKLRITKDEKSGSLAVQIHVPLAPLSDEWEFV